MTLKHIVSRLFTLLLAVVMVVLVRMVLGTGR